MCRGSLTTKIVQRRAATATDLEPGPRAGVPRPWTDPLTGLANRRGFGERLASAITPTAPLTVSIGVAQITGTDKDALKRADDALYGAKAAGGGRSVSSPNIRAVR